MLRQAHSRHLRGCVSRRCTVDVDSTPRNASGRQEGTGIHYKKHNGYHPIQAFIYETKAPGEAGHRIMSATTRER